MNKVSIAFIAVCLVTSPLAAQVVGFTEHNFGVRQNLGGGACFPPPFYENCIYDDHNYSNVNLYRLWRFHPVWNNMEEGDGQQPSYTIRLPQPPPPPAPPPTPVLREYHWPEQVDSSKTFSIVTTSGAEYLATMVWVEGANLHFNSVDGGVRQIPLTSVSESLTQIANARKNLNLPLPSIEAGEATPANSAAVGGVPSKRPDELRTKGN